MTLKIITNGYPLNNTEAYIHSSIEWGLHKQEDFVCEIKDQHIITSPVIFEWAIGKHLHVLVNYIEQEEIKYFAYQENNRNNFLTEQQKDMLNWQEESKKRIIAMENIYGDKTIREIEHGY